MALQQVVPDFKPAAGLGASVVKPLKRMVRPTPVSFRRGASLGGLVETVRANRSVSIEASAGAGKSTLVPGALVDAIGGLLVHVLPTRFLACELYKYVQTAREDCFLLESVDQQWPQAGWVLTCASVIEAKFLAAGAMVMPDCTLYHDEVHRSDAWTYLIAQQWGTITGVLKYVTASATGGTSGFRQLESDGNHVVKTFDPVHSEGELDVYSDPSLPWAVNSIAGNTLIFEDRAQNASHLVKEYTQAGFAVFRLHSRMKSYVFDAAMISLKSSELTILIADSTFRDGYTFDLTTTIDLGVIQTTSVINETPARVQRRAYEAEIYQGGARGARTAGSKMVAWRPNVTFERKRVALEEVEMDAVALVSRMLSTLVPLEAADSKLAEGMVPRDLVAALKGTQPLACLTDTQMTPLASSGYERAPSPVLAPNVDVTTPGLDYYHVGVSADVGNKHHEFVPRPQMSLESSTASSRQSEANQSTSSAGTDWTSELASWAAEAANREAEFRCGAYYYSPSVKPDVVASADFPDGWSSVLRLFGSEHCTLLYHDLSPRARDVAIAAGLQKFNMLSCESNAIMAVARDVKALGRTRSGPLVHTWMNQLLEKATGLSSEANTVARLLTGLVAGYCEIAELPASCLDVQCRALATHFFESLRNIPVADVTADTAVEVMRNSMPMIRQAPESVPVVQGAADGRYVEMARRGRAARAKPPLNLFGRWVLGYDHNPSHRRIMDKLN